MSSHALESEPRLSTTVTVFGQTLDELLARAQPILNAFFGEALFVIREIRAEPQFQTIGTTSVGAVELWRGQFEASAVYGIARGFTPDVGTS